MSLSKQQRDARISQLLADGVPVDRIADETGASPATVYRRRAVWLRQKTSDVVSPGPGAGTDYRDALAVSVEADLAVLAQVAQQLKLPPLLPDADLDTLLAVYAGI